MTKFVDWIQSLERMPSSRYGNPRFRVHFREHDSAPTEVDGSVAYGIANREHLENPVEVTLTKRGHVTYLKAVKS